MTAVEKLIELRAEAQQCTQCALAETRMRVVWGVGNVNRPPVAFVGEAPGAKEDELGAPQDCSRCA